MPKSQGHVAKSGPVLGDPQIGERMRLKVLWPVSNRIALSATIAVNGLANALPFNGITTRSSYVGRTEIAK